MTFTFDRLTYSIVAEFLGRFWTFKCLDRVSKDANGHFPRNVMYSRLYNKGIARYMICAQYNLMDIVEHFIPQEESGLRKDTLEKIVLRLAKSGHVDALVKFTSDNKIRDLVLHDAANILSLKGNILGVLRFMHDRELWFSEEENMVLLNACIYGYEKLANDVLDCWKSFDLAFKYLELILTLSNHTLGLRTWCKVFKEHIADYWVDLAIMDHCNVDDICWFVSFVEQCECKVHLEPMFIYLIENRSDIVVDVFKKFELKIPPQIMFEWLIKYNGSANAVSKFCEMYPVSITGKHIVTAMNFDSEQGQVICEQVSQVLRDIKFGPDNIENGEWILVRRSKIDRRSAE